MSNDMSGTAEAGLSAERDEWRDAWTKAARELTATKGDLAREESAHEEALLWARQENDRASRMVGARNSAEDRAEAAEAKLAKAVELLRRVIELRHAADCICADHDEARAFLASLPTPAGCPTCGGDMPPQVAPVPPPPETSPVGTTCGKAWWPSYSSVTNTAEPIQVTIARHRHCTKDEGHGDPCGKKEGRT